MNHQYHFNIDIKVVVDAADFHLNTEVVRRQLPNNCKRSDSVLYLTLAAALYFRFF